MKTVLACVIASPLLAAAQAPAPPTCDGPEWKQTWVDNTASYLDFTGGFTDGKMILARDAERQGKKFRQRMVWQDIRADAFKWLWQRSDDGGATWSPQWEIDYRRAK